MGRARERGAAQGRVPRLLEPLAVGVAGRPAQMGVMTGAATPMISETVLWPWFATQTFPELSTAMEERFNPSPVYPVEDEMGVPAMENSDTPLS